MSNCTIVVGTGIADLAAASKLRDSGKKVVVFESSVRPSGRMIRLSKNGDWAAGETQGIHTTSSETLKLINQHGLSGDIIPQINEQACYLDRKGEHLFPVGTRGMLKILGWRGSKNQAWLLIRYMIGMKKRSLLETHRDIPEHDNISVAKAFKWPDSDFRDFVLFRGAHTMAGSDLEHTNLCHFLNLMKLTLTTKVMTLREGNTRFPKKITPSLDVQHESSARDLLLEGGKTCGFELEVGKRTYSNHVILACSASADASMLTEKLAPTKELLSSFPSTPLSLVYLYLDRPVDTKAFVYMEQAFRSTTSNMAINHTVKTPHLVPSGKGIISAWPCDPDSALLDKQRDAEVIDNALIGMNIFFPSIGNMIEDVYVQRHRSGLNRFSLGQHARIRTFKRQTETLTDVSFANSDCDCAHIKSGVRADLRAAKRAIRGLALKTATTHSNTTQDKV
ncbi:FAD-dependent oxidoreductase [Pseudomonas veronii]|uniref:FAD-dependent oxidoreductase n=1 Tax=Pseudomonas veronii TaxID=76761 RepID=UPI0021C2415A|nr:FAD-dependent oxidoreductase [Pseudomonas veronii]MCT9827744.1 FAD-dependent oxidoreductase [Pseudomonas veronii]